MSEPHIIIKAGFAPYSDGSGHAVAVVIERATPHDDIQISIKTIGYIKVSDWNETMAGIDRLLSGLPTLLPGSEG